MFLQLLLILGVRLIWRYLYNYYEWVKLYPKGPTPWPFIGNLIQYDWARSQHQISEWSKKYGPVFTIFLPRRFVCIMDYELMKEAFTTRVMFQSEAHALAANGISLFSMTAVILNIFLIYTILNHTRSRMGFYKYMLIFYASFELIFAAITFLLRPLNYVSEKTWFSYSSTFIWEPLDTEAMYLYCAMYLAWMPILDAHFIYRYIVVTRPHLMERIENKKTYQCLLATAFGSTLLVSLICSHLLCNRHSPAQSFVERMKEEYGVNITSVGYHIIRTTNDDGTQSITGWSSFVVHNTFLLISIPVVVICTWRIWRSIKKMSEFCPNMSLQRQLFFTLLAQTAVPALLNFAPLVVNFYFMMIGKDSSTPHLVHFFAMFTAMQKAVDPLLVITFIKEYRKSVLAMFCKPRIVYGIATSPVSNMVTETK